MKNKKRFGVFYFAKNIFCSVYYIYMNNLSPNLQSILDNRLRYLPAVVGKAINSIDWATELITIGKKYGIHIDEMEEFQGVVLKSMIGMIAPDQFESSLISATAVSPTTAGHMIDDINKKILEPVHNYIMNPDKPVNQVEKMGIDIQDKKPDSIIFNQDSSEAPSKKDLVFDDSKNNSVQIFEVPEVSTNKTPSQDQPTPLPDSFFV